MTPLLIDAPPTLGITRTARARGKRPTRTLELDLWDQGVRSVAGVDEVGRGALAGPVVSGAVALRPYSRPRWLRDLRDSKMLSPAQRRRLAPLIKSAVEDWSVGWASSEEIDRFGILPATRLSMHRALAGLRTPAEFVLVDGIDRHAFACRFETIKKGDTMVASIAAASVVAKVARDAWMDAIAGRFAAFGFDSNKGYATAAHLDALVQAGPCDEHRRSFAPVRAAAGGGSYVLGLPLGL